MKLALSLAILALSAGAATAGGRTTAVLEFRSGTKALPAISSTPRATVS